MGQDNGGLTLQAVLTRWELNSRKELTRFNKTSKYPVSALEESLVGLQSGEQSTWMRAVARWQMMVSLCGDHPPKKCTKAMSDLEVCVCVTGINSNTGGREETTPHS